MRVPADFQCKNLIELEHFAHPKDIPGLKSAMASHLQVEADVFRVEIRLDSESADEVWLLLNGKAQISPSGEPTRAIRAVAVITALKLAERQIAIAMQSAQSANRA
jgi:hypothetical protein